MTPQALVQLERYFRYLETERRVSPHTLSAYRLDLAALTAFCDAQAISKWQQLTAAHVRDFAAQAHKGGLSPRSVARRLSAVRSFCTFLGGEGSALGAQPSAEGAAGVMRGNPAEGVHPITGKHLPAVLTVDQMEQLLNITDTDPQAVRDKAIMELLYSSGLRLSELVGLDGTDFDPRDRTVRVIGKGNKERVVPVGKQALAAIQRWLPFRRGMAKRSEPALFVGRRGERLTPRAVQVRIA